MEPVQHSLPDLLNVGPGLFREFLNSALHLRDLQKLYDEAVKRSDVPLSQSVLENLGVVIEMPSRDATRVPQTGGAIVVANHPFGLLDGLVLERVLCAIRPDVKILANSMLNGIRELRDRFIAVDVFGGQAAAQKNSAAIRHALEWLRSGHVLAIFPAGEVSHWQTQKRCIEDPAWSDLPFRLAKSTKTPIVPMFFAGENSLAFHIAGFLHPRLRTGRLPSELLNKRGRTVEVRIGSAITPEVLAAFATPQEGTGYLRARTYMLRCNPRKISQPHKTRVLPIWPRARNQEIASETQGVAAEIDHLAGAGACIVENDTFAVFAEKGLRLGAVLRELGRLREVTFRAAGEGTGKSLDLDRFDPHYTHLVLWHKRDKAIAGSYRLAWTSDVLPKHGLRGLYTTSLFRFAPAFFPRIGHAVELGRSFVSLAYQKDYAPLMLLWQAIGRCVCKRPESPVLFGAVSISSDFSQASREMIVQFLRDHRFSRALSELVSPRHPFRPRGTGANELRLVTQCLNNVEDLDLPLSDIEPSSRVPVLLRQYLKLGGQVAAFNLDRKFGNAVDALLVVDLRDTPQKLLARYMGSDGAAAFLRHSSREKPIQLLG